MTQKIQGVQDGEFLISEANGTFSRENGLVQDGDTIVAGQVVELSGNYVKPLTAGTAVGIVWANVTADGDTPVALIARNAEVSTALLTGYAGSAATDLPTIILRTA